MNRKPLLASLALFPFFAAPHMAAAQNGMTESQIPFSITTDVIDCLGEPVAIDLTVTVRTHYLELQGGRVHYVENWFMEGTAEGVYSGFTWFARGPSPFVLNAGAAQMANTLLSNLTFEPLDGGQKFFETLRFQVVVDGNGVQRVEHEPPHFRCGGR